jgi:PTH1 family peptidyl-tRNA hydrolase
VVEHLADVWHFDSWKKDGDALVASGVVGPIKTRLIKPLTYMNLSGDVLKPYRRKPFWAAATDLLVVVDDVELPFGKLRFRANGSAGGHNGLKSVEHSLGTRDYSRLRIGIAPYDPHQDRSDLADFVLDRFSKVEAQLMRDRLSVAGEAVETWLREGITVAMNKYNASNNA